MWEFITTIQRFQNTINDQLDSILRESTRQVCYAIINDTPVDTGRLVTNWLANMDEPMFQSTLDVDPTRETPKNKLNIVIETLRFEQLLHFQNNVVYGPRIEYDGWSRFKSPRGMVRINVVNWKTIVDSVRREKPYGSFR